MSGRDRRRLDRDRRLAERKPCSLAVRLRESDGKFRLNWLLDISMTGAGALVYDALPHPQVEGEIVASDVEKVFPFQARLVWSQQQTPGRVGLLFHDPSTEFQSWLTQYVSALPQ